jgi:L-lactate dehydrogenase complex protein LldF
MDPEAATMKMVAYAFGTRTRYERAQKLAQVGQLPFVHHGVIEQLPGPLAGWTAVRDLQHIPQQSFREWWQARHVTQGGNDEPKESAEIITRENA